MNIRVLYRRVRSPATRRALLVAALVCLFPHAGRSPGPRAAAARQTRQAEQAAHPREIAAGSPVADTLVGTDSHLFKLNAGAGRYARVAVDKGDFQLSAALLSSDGRVLFEYPGRRFGTLRFSFIVEPAGVAYLRLSSLERDSEARRYELRVEIAGGATPEEAEAAEAARAFAEAEALRANWEQQSVRAAAAKYAEARAAWSRAGDGREALRALRYIGECHFILSEYREALVAYTEALTAARGLRDASAELDALNDVGYVRVYLGENAPALGRFEQVLSRLAARPDAQDVETRRRKARALNNAGEVYYSLSDLRKSLDYFGRALREWDGAGDRRGAALAHLNSGYAYTDLGDLRNASHHYDRSLALWQAVGDARGRALSLTAIGGLHTFLGEKQLALDHHRQAMQTFQSLGNYQGEAAAWNGMGQVYEDLSQTRAALNCYLSALRLYERIGNRDFVALSRYYVGRIRQKLDDPGQALEDYVQSARLSRLVGDRQVEAHALKGIGTIYETQGRRGRALEQYGEVLRLYRRIGDRRWEARTLNSIGRLHEAAGDKAKALRYYARALPLSVAVADRREQVSTLYDMARAERDRGDADAALAHISSAVGLIESLRLKVSGEQLRTSYFASVNQHYELYVDLLMQAHKRRPGAGFAAAAFQANERARARSLLERLSRRGPGLDRDQDHDLLARERALWQQLDFKFESHTRLLNGPHTESEAAAGAGEIRALADAYQEVLDRIKQRSPVYASLTQTQLLDAEGIRAGVREDTILLEYALGEERSYLWAVTRGGIEGYELPPRAAVESLAREVYELLTARQPAADETPAQYRRRIETSEASYWSRAAELSRVLLGPVASRIAGKRLLIVCDGALHRIPFDALPEPEPAHGGGGSSPGASAAAGGRAVPLVVGHEVVTAPSASVLLALRSQTPGAAPSSRLIAVLADPVFGSRDSRVGPPRAARAAEPAAADDDAELRRALGDAGAGGVETSLPRLSSSLREAEAIAGLTASGERLISTGFDANLDRVTRGGLGDFRIIHFATHAIFDDERPESSGLVFSRVDENGARRDGFLRVDDIYGLRLDADLVVLSACRTGLGRDVSGEGILGITRGFMYAGSRSVIASLWKVNDEATAELMGHFYGAMFRDGLPPSAALRAAKEAMWKQQRWRSPYYWGAFVMQGEYNHAPAAAAGTRGRAPFAATAVLTPLALAALLTLAYARRRRLPRG